MSLHPGRTVIELARDMGLELSSAQAWSVGARCATAYRDVMGCDPPKDNRPKTSGSGTHCFAVYEPWFFDKARDLIRECQAATAAQLQLTFDEDD